MEPQLGTSWILRTAGFGSCTSLTDAADGLARGRPRRCARKAAVASRLGGRSVCVSGCQSASPRRPDRAIPGSRGTPADVRICPFRSAAGMRHTAGNGLLVGVAECRHHRCRHPASIADREPILAGPRSYVSIARSLRGSSSRRSAGSPRTGVDARTGPRLPALQLRPRLGRALPGRLLCTRAVVGNDQRDPIQGANHPQNLITGLAGINGDLQRTPLPRHPTPEAMSASNRTSPDGTPATNTTPHVSGTGRRRAYRPEVAAWRRHHGQPLSAGRRCPPTQCRRVIEDWSLDALPSEHAPWPLGHPRHVFKTVNR
jgi:hypothetical protein